MLRINERHNRTILGYHDKKQNNYALIENPLPITTDEDYSPFLITNSHHFSISTKDIIKLINNFTILEKFNKHKNRFAFALILPGLLFSILSMLARTQLFADESIVNTLAANKLFTILFWISTFGVVVLWHDYYRTKSHPTKLPAAPKIEERTMIGIKTSGIKFNRYALHKAVHYLSEDSQDFLVEYTKNNDLKTYNAFFDLLEDTEVVQILKRSNLQLSPDTINSKGISEASLPDYPLAALRSLIIYALDEAILTSSPTIEPTHFFLAYMRVFPVLNQYLKNNTSTMEILREVASYLQQQRIHKEEVNYLNVNYPYHYTGGIGQNWVYGYTFYMNKFSKDITQTIINNHDKFGIGHDREVEELIAVMGRLSKNNALLIGEAGVGKSSIIKGLAQRINWGTVPEQLHGSRIIQLNINALLAQSTEKGQVEKLIQKSMNELEKAGNTILFIDEIQEIIPTKSEGSGQSLAGIILPYIMDGKFPVVGTINYSGYKKYFYENETLRQSFENVEVSEVSPEDSMKILESKIPEAEKNYKLFVTFPALTATVEYAQRYVTDRKLPDSAVNVFETACSWAQSKQINLLTSDVVAQSVSTQVNIPVQNVTADEATKLLNLENKIKESVVGQQEAIHAVVESLKRSRTGIRDEKKPIGVFMFLGPTGTGKTHLSKVIAKEYFGERSKIIRVDMSEYQEVSSIQRFLGTSSSSANNNTVTLLDKVKSNPFSLVLFDEIEKAHPQILDLFLQMFDEGRLTSANGETVSFTNTMIICTSNIGSGKLLSALEDKKTMWEEAKNTALMELRGALRPELLNRYDKIVIFSPHQIEELMKITNLILNELAARVAEQGITLEWQDTVPMLIANKAQEPGMGARPIKRFIQEKIEGKIAEVVLKQGVTSGGTVTIDDSWV